MARQMSRAELDTLVVNTELTLLSITQAIALSFLGESSVDALSSLEFLWWPYILTGLLVILVFWSRSILHVITIIRWPLGFGHTFLYIIFALLESVTFRQIGHVRGWFAFSLASSLLIWFIYAFDVRMVRRMKQTGSPVPPELLAMVEHDQLVQLKFVVPLMVAFSALSCCLVSFLPGLFIDQGWHVVLSMAQALSLLGYLVHGLLFYKKIIPRVEPAGSAGA